MAYPLKVAEKTMTDYFASKDERWPAVEATEALRQIRTTCYGEWRTLRPRPSHLLLAMIEGVCYP